MTLELKSQHTYPKHGNACWRKKEKKIHDSHAHKDYAESCNLIMVEQRASTTWDRDLNGPCYFFMVGQRHRIRVK